MSSFFNRPNAFILAGGRLCGKRMILRMTANVFEWLCFVGYVDAFHLLHVGGPSHPDFSWNFDNVKEQSFDFL